MSGVWRGQSRRAFWRRRRRRRRRPSFGQEGPVGCKGGRENWDQGWCSLQGRLGFLPLTGILGVVP